MTKEQFLKTYGKPNTVVSFNNDAEKMEFLKECDKHGIRWKDGERATEWIPRHNVINLEGGKNMTSDNARYNMEKGHKFIPYVLRTPSPKSLIKDGWMGVQRRGIKVWFLPSTDIVSYEGGSVFNLSFEYDNNLKCISHEKIDITELYDNLGNIQWKREEKRAKDIEIERIQAEMNKLADDLIKLKGDNL